MSARCNLRSAPSPHLPFLCPHSHRKKFINLRRFPAQSQFGRHHPIHLPSTSAAVSLASNPFTRFIPVNQITPSIDLAHCRSSPPRSQLQIPKRSAVIRPFTNPPGSSQPLCACNTYPSASTRDPILQWTRHWLHKSQRRDNFLPPTIPDHPDFEA
jgi:hypothetical protein